MRNRVVMPTPRGLLNSTPGIDASSVMGVWQQLGSSGILGASAGCSLGLWDLDARGPPPWRLGLAYALGRLRDSDVEGNHDHLVCEDLLCLMDIGDGLSFVAGRVH